MPSAEKSPFAELSIQEVGSVRAFISKYIYIDADKSIFIIPEFLKKTGFDCVIFEGDLRDQYQCDYATKLSTVASAAGLSTATYSHFSQGAEFHYEITLDREGFRWLNDEFHGPSFCVVETSKRMVAVSDGDYYWCLAAKPEFIKSYIASIGAEHLLTYETAKLYEHAEDKLVSDLGRNLADFMTRYLGDGRSHTMTRGA